MDLSALALGLATLGVSIGEGLLECNSSPA
mgnify:CR=1 FL=1